MSGQLVQRVETFHNLTVTELVDWCLQRGLEPDQVRASGGHLKWESPETSAEAERRQEYHRRSQERHEEWERATWERLSAIYGGEKP